MVRSVIVSWLWYYSISDLHFNIFFYRLDASVSLEQENDEAVAADADADANADSDAGGEVRQATDSRKSKSAPKNQRSTTAYESYVSHSIVFKVQYESHIYLFSSVSLHFCLLLFPYSVEST